MDMLQEVRSFSISLSLSLSVRLQELIKMDLAWLDLGVSILTQPRTSVRIPKTTPGAWIFRSKHQVFRVQRVSRIVCYSTLTLTPDSKDEFQGAEPQV